jgi:hypothetical protein
MVRMRILSAAAALAVGAVLSLGATIAPASAAVAPPIVTTGAVTNITSTTAVFNGTVNDQGDTGAYAWFHWSPPDGNTNTVVALPVSTTATPESHTITGLLPATTYTYYMTGQNSAGTVDGGFVTFTTLPASTSKLPAVVTLPVTNITGTSATFNGTVNDQGETGGYSWFQWSPPDGNANTVHAVPAVATATPESSTVTGLLPATTYTYFIAGQNSAGTVDGTPVTFTTAAAGVTTQGPAPANGIPVLNYHGLGAKGNGGVSTDAWYNVTATNFATQMAWLHTNGYHTITPEQYSAWWHGSNAALPAKPILLTFDDAWLNVLTIGTPIMQQYGFQGVFYIMTGFTDNPTAKAWADNGPFATWAQLKAVQGTWLPQLHSGPCGHDYMANAPAMIHPGCSTGLNLTSAKSDPYYYVNTFGQTEAAYEARVKSDLAAGTADIIKNYGLPSTWTSSTFCVPFGEFGTAGDFFTTYMASQFPTVMVQDTYPGGALAASLNMRYRSEIDSSTTQAQFQAYVNGDSTR